MTDFEISSKEFSEFSSFRERWRHQSVCGALTLEAVQELTADELRDELAGRYIEARGLSKVDMQKALIKAMSLVAPVVIQPV